MLKHHFTYVTSLMFIIIHLVKLLSLSFFDDVSSVHFVHKCRKQICFIFFQLSYAGFTLLPVFVAANVTAIQQDNERVHNDSSILYEVCGIYQYIPVFNIIFVAMSATAMDRYLFLNPAATDLFHLCLN